MLPYAFDDRIVGLLVNAERFFAEQMFSGFDDITVKLFVQIMRHRAVYRLHVRIIQQCFVIVSNLFYGRKIIAVPVV